MRQIVLHCKRGANTADRDRMNSEGGVTKGVQIRGDRMVKENMERVGRILCLIDLDKPKDRAGLTCRPRFHELKHNYSSVNPAKHKAVGSVGICDKLRAMSH